MTEEKLNKIKLAIDQFYFNERLEEGIISDKEYDQLAAEYEAETGNSVKTLIPIKDSVIKAGYFYEIGKEAVDGNPLERAIQWAKENDEHILAINPKYDGCSIQAIYDHGRLKHILSTADLGQGINRTRNFINFFPEKVSPWIQAIQGEVIVDAKVHGELARNAANGLTNSKYKVDECEKEAYIRVYNLSIVDEYWSSDQVNPFTSTGEVVQDFLSQLQYQFSEINDKFGRIAIWVAEDLRYYTWTNKPLMDLSDGILTQIDGVVIYTENNIKAFKFYYTESAITTVTAVNWNTKSNGSFAPVLGIKPVVLSGKTISNVSANGVPNLINSKIGVGSKVRVILANTTIPKVIEVIEPSEDYQYPTCGCGYQMGIGDIYGATLKCSAEFCEEKIKLIKDSLQYLVDKYKSTTPEEYQLYGDFLSQYYFDIINCMKIDRWDSNSKFINKFDVGKLVGVEALKQFSINNAANFAGDLKGRFHFSWLAERNMKIMSVPFIYALTRIKEQFNK